MSTPPTPATTPRRRCSVRVSGVVQGVGFRPFVHSLATSLGLSGHVGNDAAGVFIEVAGPPPAIDDFLGRLCAEAPGLALIEQVTVTADVLSYAASEGTDSTAHRGMADRRTAHRGGGGAFRIVASPADRTPAGATTIPPDTAVCADCLAEMRDPRDRRHGYPFIACTHCGPRFTIATGLPYDRAATTMADFPLCPECAAEYADPASRRFHAQPTACPRCGPRLSMPVPDVVAALRDGAIVAIKGIGGYHLACDARDAGAVARLRSRKQRGDKPFAVMTRDIDSARAVGRVDETAGALLESPARPIVLIDSADERLGCLVAPGNHVVGLMLPYAPLHHLLFDAGAPPWLVMTSGNLADEPLCTDPAEAEERLAGIADVFCHHDRRIHTACDDSVVRVAGGSAQPVRRGRGYAPLPVMLPLESPPLVAVGGELKATAAVASGRRAWLSPHIGDTTDPATLAALARSAGLLADLQQVIPSGIVSDAHPGYLSHRWAAGRAAGLGVPHLVVGHHHAHLAALLAEHGIDPAASVLGVVFDGTGYGRDATIWGGELLLGSYAQVRRVGHLRPVLLPGGDAAVRHPARTALAHLAAAGLPPEGTASARAMGAVELRVVSRMLATGSHCVATTSAGRLFDAIASLLDVRHEIDYEAQAAIELESLASTVRGAEAMAERVPWPPATIAPAPGGTGAAAPHTDPAPVVIDPSPWVGRAAADAANGHPVGPSAHAFHLALAEAVAAAARTIRDGHGVGVVGLTGGVFSNALLTEACRALLESDGFSVLSHRIVPPNDGGLALGQVAVAGAGGAVPAGQWVP